MKFYRNLLGQGGSLRSAPRCEVAFAAGKMGAMALSLFTYDNVDTGWSVANEAQVTIAKLVKAIVEVWSADEIDGKTIVPRLGLVPETPNSSVVSSKLTLEENE